MMKRMIRTAAAGVTVLVLAACGQTAPTAAGEAGPRFDGGFTLGGGNAAGSGGAADSTQSAPSAATTTCEERGGFTLGGGNVAPEPCATP